MPAPAAPFTARAAGERRPQHRHHPPAARPTVPHPAPKEVLVVLQ
jgi:hypothetical protein